MRRAFPAAQRSLWNSQCSPHCSMVRGRVDKVLIANRGEIACRVIQTLRKLAIPSVAVYSICDADSPHVRAADEAVEIGAPPATDSYLNMERIIDAAKRTGATAIHPGYGFLSENPAFAKRCEDEDITFIGPSSEAIAAMGSKQEAKRLLKKHAPDVPVIPGYNGANQTVEVLKEEALKIGFPVLLKASAGGGGKGMRVVREEGELTDAIASTQSEARNSFGGDDTLLIEAYFDDVRHVEFQIMGDMHGNAMHLFERECSVQRRHQKIIEETPCVALDDKLREEMGAAAVAVAKVIDYYNAGTVEFILDNRTNKFYFLEVNARLQVEHPITEEITGLDLVEIQIAVAQGQSLVELGLLEAGSGKPLVRARGHAIECRLYAEDPLNNFFPCTGTVLQWGESAAPGIRYDSGIRSGSEVTIYYDPMVSKITAYAGTRAEAIGRMVHALRETVVLGVRTNKNFLLQVLQHERFRSGDVSTHFIQKYMSNSAQLDGAGEPGGKEACMAAFIWDWNRRNSARTLLRRVPSGWRNSPYCLQRQAFVVNDNVVEMEYACREGEAAGARAISTFEFKFALEEGATDVAIVGMIFAATRDSVDCSIDRIRKSYSIAAVPAGNGVGYRHGTEEVIVYHPSVGEHSVRLVSRLAAALADGGEDDSGYIAPMPGKVLRVLVKDGQEVTFGTTLLVLESMKMESKVPATSDGIVNMLVEEGQLVDAGTVLCKVSAPE